MTARYSPLPTSASGPGPGCMALTVAVTCYLLLEELVHLAEPRVAGVAQPLEQHHLRRHDLRAVPAGPVDRDRAVGRIAGTGGVRRPHHPASGGEQVEHRLQDAHVR